MSEYNSDAMDTIISYLIAFERLFRTKQTKKEPACSVAEQAGVPIDRVIGGLRDRKGLFYLLTLQGIYFAIRTEDVEGAVVHDFLRLVRFKADILNSGRIPGSLYG